MTYGTSALHTGNERLKYCGNAKPGCRHSKRKGEMLKELQAMTIEELKVVQFEKAPNGGYTEYAIEAQKMIWKKQHWGY